MNQPKHSETNDNKINPINLKLSLGFIMIILLMALLVGAIQFIGASYDTLVFYFLIFGVFFIFLIALNSLVGLLVLLIGRKEVRSDKKNLFASIHFLFLVISCFILFQIYLSLTVGNPFG